MKQLKVKIIENKKTAGSFYKMRIGSSYLARNSKPGQFIEVKCSDRNDPLLRRPLGVHRILKSGIELLYEVVGKGTELLSKKRAEDPLDIIGPLGNGFTLPRTTHNAQRTTILIAGGIGVAPLVALAEKLGGGHVIIGARTKSHVLCEGEFKRAGCKVAIATEDGSKGLKGLATDLLKDFIRTTNNERRTTIYACGPHPMLKAASHIARLMKIPCQVSLEERMACGLGVCLGCPVKVKTKYDVRSTMYEYKMVCKDGPVFNTEDIVL